MARVDAFFRDFRAMRLLSRIFIGAILLMSCSIVRAEQPAHFAVMDARTGELLLSSAADAPLHPSWLTKMMVLYVAFTAIEEGRVSREDIVVASAHAASQAPPRLGLANGQAIPIHELIAAVSLRHSTDAATALAEAISGSESAFVAEMNDMADAMCLTDTHFRNVQGWTDPLHTMSAHDASILARFLMFDFPDRYPLFAQQHAWADGREITSYQKREFAAVTGVDGISTNYSPQGGYGGVYSKEIDGERGRLIVSIFGEPSVRRRVEQANYLLKKGFALAKNDLEIIEPKLWECSPLLSQANTKYGIQSKG